MTKQHGEEMHKFTEIHDRQVANLEREI